MKLTANQIATATHCPLANISTSWPLIISALEEFGICSDLVQVAAAATMARETGDFRLTTREKLANPDHQPELARLQARYTPFYGRGPVGLTWRGNYQLAGEALNVDLLNFPDLACVPEHAARILAWFFKTQPSPEHNVVSAAEARRWDLVQTRVNGGMINWLVFKAAIDGLLLYI